MPSRTSGPTCARAWPSTMTTTPAKAAIEPAIERRPICSLRNNAARSKAISGAMKVSAIACASGTRPIPQKNRTAMTVTTTPRATWTRMRLAARPRPPARQVERAADEQVGDRAPDADRDDADREHEVLHHRVHDRQHRDRGERSDEGLDRMLGDAAHAPRLAAISCSRRGEREPVPDRSAAAARMLAAASPSASAPRDKQDEQQLGHGAMLRRQKLKKG